MKFIDKFRIWLQATGLKNLGLLVIVFLVLFFGLYFWTGFFLGIFVYINFNVIQKLVREVFNRIDR